MDTIKEIVKNRLGWDIENIQSIDGGERSKAFWFEYQNIKYVFRFNYHEEGFKKDQYAYENFGKFVVIPKVIDYGPFEDKFFAISEYCQGGALSGDGVISDDLCHSLVGVVENLKKVSLSDKDGFGVTNVQGNSEFQSWESYVLRKNTVVTRDDGSYFSWEDIKQMPEVDATMIEKVFKKISDLVSFIPNERHLIHGDFGPGNIIIDKDMVTGVIDWNEFGYGDCLYDLAYFDFWTNSSKLSDYYIRSQTKPIANFEARMLCHKLYIGLTALGIYAAIGLRENYQSVLVKLKDLV